MLKTTPPSKLWSFHGGLMFCLILYACSSYPVFAESAASIPEINGSDKTTGYHSGSGNRFPRPKPGPDLNQNAYLSWESAVSGIFSISLTDCLTAPDPTITAFSSDDPAENCTALVKIPDVTIGVSCTGGDLTYILEGATTGNGTGQITQAVFNPGLTTITYSIKDITGMRSTETVEVEVKDQAPSVSVPVAAYDLTTSEDGSDDCTATIDLIDVAYSDECDQDPELSWKLSGAVVDSGLGKLQGYNFPLGSTTLTYRVTDVSSNFSEVSVSIKVRDIQSPFLKATPDLEQHTDSGECHATIDLPEPDFSDNCNTSFSWSMIGATTGSGSNVLESYAFNEGVTILTYTVTDDSGLTTKDDFEVRVTDNQPPSVTAAPDITEVTGPEACKVLIDVPAPAVSDNCGASLQWKMTGATTAQGDLPINTYSFNPGTTKIIYTVTDPQGFTATDSLQVNVLDQQAPKLSTGDDLVLETEPDSCAVSVSVPEVAFSDNCNNEALVLHWEMSGATQETGTGQIGLYSFGKGVTSITYSLTDTSGNSTTDEILVTVTDNQAPEIHAPEINRSTDPGKCSAMVSMTATAKDNCPSVQISGVRDDGKKLGEPYPVGTTIITWNATDQSGNPASEVTQEVNITDDEDPLVPQLAPVVSGCTITLEPPVATDNCENNIAGVPDRSTTFSSSGEITWTFTDASNNTSSVTQQVSIDSLKIDSWSTTRTSIYGRNDGSATVTPSGGVAPYTYQWRVAGTSNLIHTGQTATSLAAGEYEVLITDASGCTIKKILSVVNAVQESLVSTTECLSVHDYVRTSTLQVDLDNIRGGIGDPANFTYIWDFGDPAEIVSISPGPDSSGNYSGTGAFEITWKDSGDKVLSLTIIDEAGVKKTYDIPHYVGACFEGCGATSNFKMNTDNFFIGDKYGNRLTGETCLETTEKYMWIDIIDNANGYALSAEMNYVVNDGSRSTSRKAIGCFEEVTGRDNNGDPIYAQIPEGLFRLFPVASSGDQADKIIWKCGETFKVEGINIRWTNSRKDGCNQGNKPMCFGPETEVIVKVPLMVEATAEPVLCNGADTGSLILRAAGGQAPYQFSINGREDRVYQDSNEFYNLPAGDYTYMARDSEGVVTSGKITITEPTKITADIRVSTAISCYGTTGTAVVENAGGGTPFRDADNKPYYKYSWNSGQVTPEASGLSADVLYTATITDANGCTLVKEIKLSQPAQLTQAEAGEPQVLGCGIRSTRLSANVPAAGEKGWWTIVSGEGGSMTTADMNNPGATFSGSPGTTYVLSWTIANDDLEKSCPDSDQVSVSFGGECSTLNFDGIDDYISMGDEYDFPNSNFTLEAWIKPKSVNSTSTILSKRNSGDFSEGGYDLSIINGYLYFRWNANLVRTDLQIGTDRWYHVAVIFRDAEPRLYVDGLEIPLQINISNPAPPAATAHPFMIGATYYVHTPEKPKSHFKGWIEEVRIWKTAISVQQLRFMMNQRIRSSGTAVKGVILPMEVPGFLSWFSLEGYYQLLVDQVNSSQGTTPDLSTSKPSPVPGHLKNIEETQENTAPLPYYSAAAGNWWDKNSWLRPDAWDPPNSQGINGEPINWNIAEISHDLHSDFRNIRLLGLMSNSGTLNMKGQVALKSGTGNALAVSHYLRLNGIIDLNGESQLVQAEGSILQGTGSLERDQQGTASSFNYNYWSSPVLPDSFTDTYTVGTVLYDGTTPGTGTFKTIRFNGQYRWADTGKQDPIHISTYWINAYHPFEAGKYSGWSRISNTAAITLGEGFTMKGSWGISIVDAASQGLFQNYTFMGFPGNGTIRTRSMAAGQNYLVGNPYPSAIDAHEFILENLKDVTAPDGRTGRNTSNIFNGSLYFWDHFAGASHYLQHYIGGYAIYNFAGGVEAISTDWRINNTGEHGTKKPGRYIPVGQGFFINSTLDSAITQHSGISVAGGTATFKNRQRVFRTEAELDEQEHYRSVFHTQERKKSQSPGAKEQQAADQRSKVWLKMHSPAGYHRQLLVTSDPGTTAGFDLAYDAPLIENNQEDMYWLINENGFIIQAVPEFSKNFELPLEIKVAKKGQFRISLDKMQQVPDHFEIHLKDTSLAQTHDLRTSAFEFAAEPGLIQERFSIVFLNNSKKDKQNLEDPGLEALDAFYINSEEAIRIINPELIHIESGSLYSLSGQFLQRYGLIPTQPSTKLAIPLKTSGIYIMNLQTSRGPKSIKFIVQH